MMEQSGLSLRTVLVLGCGVLGGRVLDELARAHPDVTIYAAGRRADGLEKRVNLARYAAYNYGPAAEIIPVQLDVLEVAQTTAFLSRAKPDLVFNATSMIPWWRLDQLPSVVQAKVKSAGTGIWAAPDLLPALQLRAALQQADFQGLYVNGSFPDLVNKLVYTPALGPVCGTGNVANVVPGIALAAAHLLDARADDVTIRLVAHHYLTYNIPLTGESNGAPFALQVRVKGEDVTSQLDQTVLLRTVAKRFSRVKGIGGEAVAVSSAMSVLTPLITGEARTTHAPGVFGLPGGYPVSIRGREISLDLPEELSIDAAVRINEEGGRWDGIDGITEQGEVIVSPSARRLAIELFEYDANGVTELTAMEKAHEMVEKFERYASSLADA